MDQQKQDKIEAAVFRRFLKHLGEHTEVQNIELMITADFCRNCLSKWYSAAAAEQDEEITYEQAREYVYGMPYPEWKDKFQTPATPEQAVEFERRRGRKLNT